MRRLAVLPLLLVACAAANSQRAATAAPQGPAWERHVIDDTGRGSDGTKLADINRDGWPDITTGWEEDGSTRVYLNPGPRAARGPWKRVIVGSTPSAEDAVFADLDGDGNMDVVTSTEGNSQRVFVHWAPEAARMLDAAAWRQEVFPATVKMTRWMFAEPFQVDGRHGVDLIIGGKRGGEHKRSVLGWLEAPAAPRTVAGWRWHALAEVGWTMTIQLEDMDGDGDRDVLYSDRLDDSRGIYWLENPGVARAAETLAWRSHRVPMTAFREVMFLGLGDVDGDGLVDIAAPVALGPTEAAEPNRHSELRWYRRLDRSGDRWTEQALPIPANTGNVKSVALADVDGDSRTDFVVSCESARGVRIGVYWLKGDGRATGALLAHDISGELGVKFDLVRMLDLDGDGDLDVLTNDEQEAGRGLGVIWYENPRKP